MERQARLSEELDTKTLELIARKGEYDPGDLCTCCGVPLNKIAYERSYCITFNIWRRCEVCRIARGEKSFDSFN